MLRLTLKEKYETIKTLDAEIIELIDDEAGLTEEIERADGYKEGIFASLIKTDQLLESPTATPVALHGTTKTATTPVGRTKSVSLPKLQLRHFNGDLTKWTSLWESFEAGVHKNSDLSGVEKFNYLSSLLEGTAKEAVSGLSLTEANYTGAVSMLKKRFGSTQMIVSKHMEALLQVEAVSSTLDVKALRRLFDTISSHVRSLSAMNVQEDSYSNLLCPVLINKIPPELQLIVSRKVSEENWSLGKLMAAIEEEVIARERLGWVSHN